MLLIGAWIALIVLFNQSPCHVWNVVTEEKNYCTVCIDFRSYASAAGWGAQGRARNRCLLIDNKTY